MAKRRKPLVLLIILHLADSALTAYGLDHGLVEGMPIARLFLNTMGSLGLLVLPLIALAIQIPTLSLMPRQFRNAGWAITFGVQAIPVISNTILLATT